MGNAAINGTPTSTGGAILPSSKNETLTIEGRTIALIGDIASCNCGLKHCKKTGPIVANPANPRAVFFDNIPWALAGDFVNTGCGLCSILDSSHDVMVGTDVSSAVNIPKGVKMSITTGMSFNMGTQPVAAMQPTAAMATTAATFGQTHFATSATMANHGATATANQAVMASHSTHNATATRQTDTTSVNNQTTTDGWKVVQGISPDKPLLVYQTEKKMNDMHAADLQHGDENKEKIMKYGLHHPFKDKLNLKFNHAGFINQAKKEDQFTLQAEEHFKRMRNLGDRVVMMVGFSMYGGTSNIFYDMVDKFQRNEGGFFHDDRLTIAIKNHETTKHFHEALKTCLRQNINPDGSLPPAKQLQTITSDYLKDKDTGVSKPKFNSSIGSIDLLNGTVLTVHDIWAMQVYIERLEYKGEQVRGVFNYKIEDHFGLDSKDINHPNFKSSFDTNHPIDSSVKMVKEMAKKFEILEGFRSWYILQHYQGYNYKPFTTQMSFFLNE